MKKIICSIFICLIGFVTVAQQAYPGYRSGNYSGINGVFFNPANIADSRYRWSVNLFSFNAGVGNNTASFKLKDLTSSSSNNIQDKFFTGKGNSNASVNVDVFGPSVMFNLNKKSAIALTTRARVMANLKDIDGNLLNEISDSADQTYPYTFSSSTNSRIISNGWTELGLAYAREIVNKGKNYFKGGITFKYLSGVGNNYIQFDKLKGTINENLLGDSYLENASGTINIGSGGASIDSITTGDLFKKGQSGFGFDIGFAYEYRPDYASGTDDYRKDLNKYKFKISMSLLDVGKIKYVTNASSTGGYAINIAGPEKFFLNELEGKNTDEVKSVLNSHPDLFTPTTIGTAYAYKVSLPTTLQVEMDYHLHRGFFASLGGQVNLINKNSFYNPNQYNSITLTPRYEGKAFGLYLPINYNELTDFNVGVSLRAGPLFLGSGSIITAIAKSKQADVHFGLRFGILHKKKKMAEPVVQAPPPPPVVMDRDGDGILDADDKCPDTPGLASLQGCPDRDGDGIADGEDKCPDVAGLAKYQGCPIPDTDGDGINDEEDKCITVKGIAKYQGCPIPDTDGDGVNDEEDKCPTRAGTAANSGCPVIAKEIIDKINFAAKNVFFATGSYKLLPKSFKSLNEVANLMKADESLMVDIDGHTDAQGTDESNQVLSDNRAGSVKEYLIKQGVDTGRLKSAGYGETKPVADNTSAAGRAKNRRTEMTVRNF